MADFFSLLADMISVEHLKILSETEKQKAEKLADDFSALFPGLDEETLSFMLVPGITETLDERKLSDGVNKTAIDQLSNVLIDASMVLHSRYVSKNK